MLDRRQAYLKNKLAYPAEAKDTEYKSAVRFDEKTDFATKLVKHILGFANSGGGYIIIGFREKADKSLEPDPAMTDEITASYEVTRLCQYVEKYLMGQDRIKIEVHKVQSSQGTVYPVISVGRFPEYPFTCTKDYISKNGETILESGQIYVRTEGARTLTVKAPSEWRQLIRECIKSSREVEAKKPTEEKGDRWEKLFSSWVKRENDNATREIKAAGFSGGFYRFIIRVPYGLNKIDNTTLLEIARNSECHNTGWPIGVVLTKPEYKPVSLTDGIRATINTVLATIVNVDIREFDYWALNNRGHFFFMRSQEEHFNSSQKPTKDNKALDFDVVIWRISEILNYASNLCSELKLKQNDIIELNLYYEGLQGRILSASRGQILPSLRTGPSIEDIYEKRLELHVGDIMPKLKEHVYTITLGLFGLFDFCKFDRAKVDRIVNDFLNSPL